MKDEVKGRGISKCDVNHADVTLRGNRAAVADWLYPVADPEPSGPVISFIGAEVIPCINKASMRYEV